MRKVSWKFVTPFKSVEEQAHAEKEMWKLKFILETERKYFESDPYFAAMLKEREDERKTLKKMI